MIEYSEAGAPINIRVKDETFIHSIAIIEEVKKAAENDVQL